MTDISALANLEYLPFLDQEGQIIDRFDHQVGVYAVFNADRTLQYVGYSRDVSLSLKQHLVSHPQQCYWLKVQTIDRPSRTVLEEIRAAWIAENGVVPVGNRDEEITWTQPIDAKQSMTTEEQTAYAAGDDLTRVKLLKQVARRVETEVLAALADRGVKMAIRFDPKAKEEGRLNLK